VVQASRLLVRGRARATARAPHEPNPGGAGPERWRTPVPLWRPKLPAAGGTVPSVPVPGPRHQTAETTVEAPAARWRLRSNSIFAGVVAPEELALLKAFGPGFNQ
jgi:hypothetical protein